MDLEVPCLNPPVGLSILGFNLLLSTIDIEIVKFSFIFKE